MPTPGTTRSCLPPPPPEDFSLGPLTSRFIVRPENREHLKYFRNVYCVMTNHSKDQSTRTKPPNQKLISVLSFLTPDWLFSCNTIAFQKYYCCSRFSRFDCKRFPATRILPISFLCVFCSIRYLAKNLYAKPLPIGRVY